MARSGDERKKGLGLLDIVLKWTVEDVYNKDLYKEKVRKIPELFHSVEDYLGSFVYPLIEETRAELREGFELVHEKPLAELLSVKGVVSSGFGYIIEVDSGKNGLTVGGRDRYEPMNSDIVILSTIVPEDVADFNRYGTFYCLAALRECKGRVGDDEVEGMVDGSEALEEEEQRKNVFVLKVSNCVDDILSSGRSLYVIFLMSISTNSRIWHALNVKSEEPRYENIKKFEKLLNGGNLATSTHDTCYMDRVEIVGKEFLAELESSMLNDSQIDAVVGTISSLRNRQPYMIKLIWGPPGTGKTKTISFILSALTKMNFKALTCAPTNVAVLEVASRFLKLVRDCHGRVTGDSFTGCFLGDMVLFGNKTRMDIVGELNDIFLDYRVDRLLECFVPLTGWNYRLRSMIDFFEDYASQYKDFLETDKGKENASFLAFLRERFNAISSHVNNCISILYSHLPKIYMSKSVSDNLIELHNLIESFGNLLFSLDIDEDKVKVLLKVSEEEGNDSSGGAELVEDGSLSLDSVVKELRVIRRSCLRVLGVLKVSLILPRMFSKSSIQSLCLKNASLVFCTVSSSSLLHSLRMESPLDVLIIDEAAQLKECESSIPLQLAGLRHVILIGDECQLPAMVHSKVSTNAGYGRSLFARLGSLGHPKHLLNIQYRMHPSISSFPSATFYGDQILDGPNVMCRSYEKHYLPRALYGSYSFINIRDGREVLDDISKSWKNMVEVAVVSQIVQKLLNACSSSGQRLTVGVISPYNAQVCAIQEKLKRYEMHDGFALRVKSVDGFQGSEDDVIIISTVRCNGSGDIGFVSSRFRTNVALTRARHCLWIMGNAGTLIQSGSVWEELICNAKDRGCYFDALEDKGLADAILRVKSELEELDDLLNKDSSNFANARWQVLFADDFKKSFAKLRTTHKKQMVLRLLLRLANGWRPKRNLYFVEGVSSGLIKQSKVEGLILIWTVDIVRNTRCEQVLKVWDILPFVEVSKLLRRLDNFFSLHTEVYLQRCKEKLLEGNLEVPKSWATDFEIVQYKNLCKSDHGEPVEEGRLETGECMESSKVSESLVLMKFYSLSSGVVNQLLTATDGREVDLPFELTYQEREIILFPESAFILGRSGTGKTTVLTMRLIRKEQQYYVASEGLDVDGSSSEVTYSMYEQMETSLVSKRNFLRQIFVTVSPKLCAAVKSHIHRLKRHTSGSDFSVSLDSIEMHDASDNLTEFRDIPDNLDAITERHFPLIITFRKLLLMLDQSMMPSFFYRFHDLRELPLGGSRISQSIALQRFIARNEVDYEHFVNFYWPHFNGQFIRNLDPSTVFTQIISHIKGGFEVGSIPDKLGREVYVGLSEGRVSTLSKEKRERVYDIFLDYERKKLANGHFDMSDLVIDIHCRLREGGYKGENFDFVYIDEVQDLTMRQIALFKHVCSNVQEGYVFSGDTAQTIARGIDFRFEDIRSLFYKEFLNESREGCLGSARGKETKISDLFHLNQNFRTHAGVLMLAESVLDLLYSFFPQSIDVLDPEMSLIYGESPVLLESENDENAIMTIFGNSGTIGEGSHEFGAEQVILVRDDSAKKQIFDYVGMQALVLTIIECKGLEFQDVLLYDFFGASPLRNQWRVIYEYMANLEWRHSEVPKSFPHFDEGRHNILCSELKQLYVAITRTKQRLWICENSGDFCKPMFDYWKSLGLVQVRLLDSSLAEGMRVASSPEEWRRRAIKLFNDDNYEMATMCFERAGDVQGEKWARAAGLQATADRILLSDPQMARIAMVEAANIYETINKVELAANCYIKLEEFQKAGNILLEKCGMLRLEDAGDCFSMAHCWSEAADVYFKAGVLSKCLNSCTKGEIFEMGLHYILHWEDSSPDSQVARHEEVSEVKNKYLENSADYYFCAGDIKRMMRFIKVFASMGMVRSFLKSRKCLDELLQVEMEAGNFVEAADVARTKGDLLLMADMLEKAGQPGNSSRLLMLFVVVNSLWTPDSKGWPLKQFEGRDQLLEKAKGLSLGESSVVYESVSAEVSFLSKQNASLSFMVEHLNVAQNLQNIRLELFACHSIIDFHLLLDPSKFHWESAPYLDPPKDVDGITSQNKVSVVTLMYYWNLWKQRILSILSYLASYDDFVGLDYHNHGKFCLEYFGVLAGKDWSRYAVINSFSSWMGEKVRGSLSKQGDLLYISAKHFVLQCRKFWESELLSVGIKLLEKLEALRTCFIYRSLSQFSQGVIALNTFEVSNFLNDPQYHRVGYIDSKLKGYLRLSKEWFLDICFPLDWRNAMEESLVYLREHAISGKIVREIHFEMINPGREKLSYGQIGQMVLLLFVSQKHTDELYKSMVKSLDHFPQWQSFIEQWMDCREMGWEELAVLVPRFGDAVKSVYEINWRNVRDYVSPRYYILLVERLLFLLCSCQRWKGCFFTTKSCLVEMVACQDWEAQSRASYAPQEPNQYFCVGYLDRIYDFISYIIRGLLFNIRDTTDWVNSSNLKHSSYLPSMVLRLVIILGLVCLNSGRNYEFVSDLSKIWDILSFLPPGFHQWIRSVYVHHAKASGLFLRGFAEALQAIGNPLVVMLRDSSEFSCPSSIILAQDEMLCKETVLKALFPKITEGSQCKDQSVDSNAAVSSEIPPFTTGIQIKGQFMDVAGEQHPSASGDYVVDFKIKFGQFWEKLLVVNSLEQGWDVNTGSLISDAKRIKMDMENYLQVVNCATVKSGAVQQKFRVLDVSLLGELKGMVGELDLLSETLDLSKKELQGNDRLIQGLCDKLLHRRPLLEPLMESMTSVEEPSTPITTTESSVASEAKNGGNKGKDTKKNQKPKGKNKTTETSVASEAKNGGNKGNKGKDKKKNQKPKGKNKKKM
ncbi:uncharacterized protein LOC18437732 [Amborella trichopoda]|nr:uncharacterized protein LOC18437732 [Amborella trichopoda]|eukprot:XP_020524975.1 uncharacterized protein LOC18437732 [Amborella trichopoda]